MEQSSNTSNTSSASGKSSEDTFRTDLGKTVLPLVEEHVVISKEIIETGKVFIRKRVHEEEASVNIPIIQEGYEMKRLPGKKTLLKEYPSIRYEGDNMIIPVVKEVLVIEKRYEVIEEVHLTKTKTQIPHLQQITLLKETVEVERKKTNPQSLNHYSLTIQNRRVMAHTVVGLFKSDSAAQSAAYNLQTAGFSETDIDIADGSHYTNSTAGEQKTENGITRFFKNLFGDNDDDAQSYATAGNEGHSIVTVHASSQEEAQRAADLLDEYGAVELDNRGKAYDSTDDTGTTIQRVEEELQVGRQEVATGGVRLRSRIVNKPVEETLRLRRERVTVERQAVNRPLTDSDTTAFQDQDIELTERAEVPVVNKEARVVEEIRLTKEVDERNETIHDTVRHTEVDVDPIADNSRKTDLSS